MTSRISSFKIRREDMKHRPAMLLISIFLFFLRDLFLFIAIQNSRYTLSDGEKLLTVYRDTIRMFTAPNAVFLLYLLPLAALLAINGFHYLHNRSRVDFMHSLPVSRGRLYRMILGNNLLIFLVPYLVSLGVETVYVRYLGCFDRLYLTWMTRGILYHLLVFLLFYLLMVLCMLLTGNTIVSLLAFGVFLSYSPVMLQLTVDSYASIFLKTYNNLSAGLIRVLDWLSPLILAGRLGMDHSYTWMGRTKTASGENLIVILVWIAVLLVATYLAHNRFPSERSGSAMVFRRGRKLIKFLIVVPLALCVGLVFYGLTLSQTTLWLYFGVVFGAFIFHGLVECIYRFDIRGLWSSRVDLLFAIILAVLSVLCFDVDIIRFDERTPDTDRITSVNVVEGISYDQGRYTGSRGIKAENAKEVCRILGRIADENKLAGEEDPRIYVSYYYPHNRVVTRKYQVDQDILEELKRELYRQEEYRKEVFPILGMPVVGTDITELNSWHPVTDYYSMNLTAEEKETFLTLLKEELDRTDYEEMTSAQPVASVEMTYLQPENYQEDYPNSYVNEKGQRVLSDRYEIYPSFQKTIAFLEEHGARTGSTAADYDLRDVVLNYNISGENTEACTYETYTIKDPEFIASIKDKLYFINLDPQDTENKSLDKMNYVSAKIDGIEYGFRTDPETIGLIYKKAREN